MFHTNVATTGPSNDHYDYGQLLKFMLYPHDDTPSHISTHLPCGCKKIIIYSLLFTIYLLMDSCVSDAAIEYMG